MFNKITLKNYRTHKLTTLELQPITLLIGNNNSGKTNLLSGVQHFSQLIARGNAAQQEDRTVGANDYFPHLYRFAKEGDSLSIEIEWSQPGGFINYAMELYQSEKLPEMVGCRERIEIAETEETSTSSVEFESGYETESNLIELQIKINDDETIKQVKKDLLKSFFRDCNLTFSYHLQPSFLKGMTDEYKNCPRYRKHSNIYIPSSLGYEGENFLKLLDHIIIKKTQVYTRFRALVGRFNNNRNFKGIRWNYDQSKLVWEFDLGRTTIDDLVDEFSSEFISDGLIKAAAIALLVSVNNPPL